MRSCVLMGPPGSGKTTMWVKTLPRRKGPIVCIDVDRKLRSMSEAIPLIEKGDIVVWEVDSPLIEEKLSERLRRYVNNEKPLKPPKGWYKIAQFCEDLETKPEGREASAWIFDSATVMGAHALRLITYLDDKGHATMSPRNWAAYLNIWQETMTEVLDAARRLDIDVIFTVHQRAGEVPSENNKVLKRRGEGGVVDREYLGSMDVKIVPSIQGQFAMEMGAYVEEFYGLDVVMEKDVPKWVCRVLPDGKRDLRTSFPVKGQAVFPPDFKLIWK